MEHWSAMNGDEHPPPRNHPRILWGRVAFYGLSLLLVFALGSWSAADDTADAQLAETRAEVERLAQENVNLRAEKEALEAGGALDAEASAPDDEEPDDPEGGGPNGIDPGDTDPDGSVAEGSESPAEDDGTEDGDDGDGNAAEAVDPDEAPAAEEPGSGTYVVRQGDTGMSIAEEVYGDQDLWPLIAEANDLGGANALQVDQELVIPPSD